MTAATLRRDATILKWLVTVPLAGFVLLVAVVFGNVAYQNVLHGDGRYLRGVAIFYAPILLYLWAIWTMRRALVAIAAGASFAAIVPRALLRVGIALFGGALLSVFAVPLLTLAVFGKPFVQTFDGSAVTLGIVGAVLVMVARLLARTREELKGFV